MKPESHDNLVLIGKVIRPHGLNGFLRIKSYAQSEESFLESGMVFLKPDFGEFCRYEILSIKPHKNIFLVKLKDLDSFEEAEKLRDAAIFVEKETLRQGDEDDFFWYELIGLSVYLDNGKFLGTIINLLPTGSNDIYIVRKDKKDFYIPAIYDVVKEIDLKNKRMIISAMEGMLDLNEV